MESRLREETGCALVPMVEASTVAPTVVVVVLVTTAAPMPVWPPNAAAPETPTIWSLSFADSDTLAASTLDDLEKTEKLPAAVVEKLKPLIGRPSKTKGEFEAALRSQLDDQFDQYAPLLLDSAAVSLPREARHGSVHANEFSNLSV